MNLKKTLFALCSVLLLNLCAEIPTWAEGKNSEKAKIGVVDMLSLLDRYEKSKMLEGRLEKEFGEEKNELGKVREEILRLQGELRLAGAKTVEKIRGAIRKKEVDFKYRRESLEGALTEKQQRFTREVYLDIKGAVQKYGKDEGYDYIIKKSGSGKNSVQQMQMEMLSNVVLYHREEYDLTDRILKVLNENYSKKVERKD